MSLATLFGSGRTKTPRNSIDVSEAAGVRYLHFGSEWVQGAMRIARTVTGRKTIAIFTNSYHGIFDEVIVRGTKKLRAVPATRYRAIRMK